MPIETIKTFWPEWDVDETPLGKGSYGAVYRMVRQDHNIISTSAVKIISIPSDPTEIEALRRDGFGADATRTYLQGVVNDFVGEIQLMETLKGVPNIVNVEDYKVIEKPTKSVGRSISAWSFSPLSAPIRATERCQKVKSSKSVAIFAVLLKFAAN